MLVAETAAIDSGIKLPDGVRLDLVTDGARRRGDDGRA